MKTLYAFDLDDTLFTCGDNLKISIKNFNTHEIIRYISTHDLAENKLHAHEYYDFDEFRSAETFVKYAKPLPLLNYLKVLNGSFPPVEAGETIIVTARSDLDSQPIFADFMMSHGIDINQTHVYRAGNNGKGSTAKNKVETFRQILSEDDYNTIIFFDDSKENIDAFLKLSEEYPNTYFRAQLVDKFSK